MQESSPSGQIQYSSPVQTSQPQFPSPPKVRLILTLCIAFISLTYISNVADLIATVSRLSSMADIVISIFHGIGFILACANLFILPICFQKLLIRRRQYNISSKTEFCLFIITSILTAIANCVFYLNIFLSIICFVILYPIIASSIKRSHPSSCNTHTSSPTIANSASNFQSAAPNLNPQSAGANFNTTITTPPTYNIKRTRGLILIFTAIELLIASPLYLMLPFTIRPISQTLGIPFPIALSLTVFTIPFTIIFSRIIHERIKHLNSPIDKLTQFLRICFTLTGLAPFIVLGLALFLSI